MFCERRSASLGSTRRSSSTADTKMDQTADSITPFNKDFTPNWDNDGKPKVQICLEWREKEIVKSKSKKTEHVLEVTLMRIKNFPKHDRNNFFKLTLLPQNVFQTTQPHAGDMEFIELVTFPLRKYMDLKGHSLEIQVCKNKVTRNAKSSGSANIPLEQLNFGKSTSDWYSFKDSEILNPIKGDKIVNKVNKKEKRLLQKAKDEDDEAIKENIYTKTKTNFLPIYN